MTAFEELETVTVDPATARVYAEGWQSWSPAGWYGAGRTSPRPEEPWQHAMRFRPGTDLDADGIQAEGLLVVDPGNGDDVRVYGARTVDDVPTLRAHLAGTRLTVTGAGPVTCRHEPTGVIASLAAVGDAIAASAGARPLRAAPTVWCSWYRYFESVTAHDIEKNLAAIRSLDLPVDVVQIDDGWSLGLGEWMRPAAGFPDLPGLVHAVQDGGKRVGLWLAPFVVGVDTDLARTHPDWLVGYTGHNWGQDLAGLDLTHPDVRDLVASTVTDLRDLGVDYLKLDFLYAGAVPGRRHENATPIEAYRSGLELVRRAAGPDTYVLGCGAPLLPSIGLVDAMRVSPDTFHEGGEDGSRGLRGRPSLEARAWQHGRLWVNDPDCLVARPTYRLRAEWAEIVERFGGMRSFSDDIDELDDWGLGTVRRIMSAPTPAEPFPDDLVELTTALDGHYPVGAAR